MPENQRGEPAMFIKILPLLLFGLLLANPAAAQFEKDVLESATGDLVVTFLGHASLLIEYNDQVIQVDPWSKLADYSNLPKADLVLITHQHPDHLDPVALGKTRKPTTKVIITELCRLVHKRDNGAFYHPKGEGNGYLLTFNKTRLYIAGDTENIPEMKELKDIDYAFLPMNLPYTMTPEMVADAVRSFRPKVLYPYHYGETDPKLLLDQLRGLPEVEVRIRRMK
jgi:L-ascorbate metabolism protein UlaG (beta-lactamase superfamily)